MRFKEEPGIDAVLDGARYMFTNGADSALGPRPAIIEPGKPLVIVEGEFDALVLGQTLGDLAAVVTLGSASSQPEAATLVEAARRRPVVCEATGR